MNDVTPAYASEVDDAMTQTQAAMPGIPPALAYAADDYIPPPAPAGRSRWALSLAALLAAVAAVIVAGAHGAHVLAAPKTVTVTAAAPDRNTEFLTDLNAAGVGNVYSRGDAVVNGYFVCVALGMGKTETDIIGTTFAPPMGKMPAAFVKTAEKHYCPGGHLRG